MKLIPTPKNQSTVELDHTEAYWEQLTSSSSATHASLVHQVTHQAYHEMADQPLVEMDDLAQLNANLETLSQLQGRLTFVMREVKYLMKA